MFDTTQEEPELKYLFWSNGGTIGFYSDMVVRGCARCDPDEENVKRINYGDPYATYSVADDGLMVHSSSGEHYKMEFKSKSSFPEWLKVDSSRFNAIDEH